MSRRAWFAWRAGSRGLTMAVHFDTLPGPDGSQYGPPIIATHELTGESVDRFERGSLTFGDLAAMHPPPRDHEPEGVHR